MNKSLLLAFLFITPYICYCQKWRVGIINSLDFNLYKFYNSDYNTGRSLVKPDIGLTFSLATFYYLNDRISFQGGLGITTKQLVPDLNKIDHIFESVHYTSLEIPVRIKYSLLSFDKPKTEVELPPKAKNRRKKNNRKVKTPFNPNAFQLTISGGFNYSQMLKVKPQYFDDGTMTYPPLSLKRLIYPEIGIGISKKFLNNHLVTLDIITRVSRQPYEFSTKIVEKMSIEFGYYIPL